MSLHPLVLKLTFRSWRRTSLLSLQLPVAWWQIWICQRTEDNQLLMCFQSLDLVPEPGSLSAWKFQSKLHQKSEEFLRIWFDSSSHLVRSSQAKLGRSAGKTWNRCRISYDGARCAQLCGWRWLDGYRSQGFTSFTVADCSWEGDAHH